MPGAWKNFEDLEENLTIAELNAIVQTLQERRMEDIRFQASLQGVKIEDDLKEKRKEIEERAAAKIAGVSTEQLGLAELGIEITEE